MVKVFEANDLLQAHFVRSLLVREGIRAVVLGEQLQSGIAPGVVGAQPQVWVREAQAAQATQIVGQYVQKEESKSPRSAKPWTCPSCREVIEPQFTECWKCGESRPQDASTMIEEKETPVGKYLDIEVACTNCGYNLLALEPSGKCPECGRPVVLSLLAVAQQTSLDPGFDVQLSLFIDRTLEESGYSSAAALFLLDAWPRALDALPSEVDASKQAQAIETCWNVVDIAISEYQGAAQALAMFRAWGFHDCQSLGASLFAFIAREWLSPVTRLVLVDFPPVPIESIFPPNDVSDVGV